MRTVSEIRSNLPRVTVDYDTEMSARQSYANPPEFQPDIAPVDLEEALGSREEINYEAARRRRWTEQKYFMGKEAEAMRLVNFLHPHTIFRKLQQAGVDARIEAPHFYVWVPDDSTGKLIQIKRERSVGRLWLHDEAVQGRVGVSAWVWNPKLRTRERKMVTTLQYPYGPEWSLMYFDENDVPISERYRGWRTAMLQLIEADVLTEDEVNRAFGQVPLGVVSSLYRKKLQFHRKKRYGLIQ
jgi:hypothetical protein